MNLPSSVSSAIWKLDESPYAMRLRSLRDLAFRLRWTRGMLNSFEISLRAEVIDVGTVGMCVRIRI